MLRPLLPSGWLGICHRNGKTTQRLQGQRKMVRHSIREQQLGAGLPRNMWLSEIQQQNLISGPLSLTLRGIWAKQAGDRLNTALMPRLQVTMSVERHAFPNHRTAANTNHTEREKSTPQADARFPQLRNGFKQEAAEPLPGTAPDRAQLSHSTACSPSLNTRERQSF